MTQPTEVPPSIPNLVSNAAKPSCEFCEGGGWVCEDDPTIPAHSDHCCGIGQPCDCTGLEGADHDWPFRGPFWDALRAQG